MPAKDLVCDVIMLIKRGHCGQIAADAGLVSHCVDVSSCPRTGVSFCMCHDVFVMY